MKRTLDQIRTRIFEVIKELREDAERSTPSTNIRHDGGAGRLQGEFNMFVDGYKACLDAYIEETNRILDPETLIDVPVSWRQYFTDNDPKNSELASRETQSVSLSDDASKRFSMNDVLSNFDEYFTTNGFDYDDTMYQKISKYMIWLSKRSSTTQSVSRC